MWERTNPSRRDFLARAGNGFGLVALADLLAGQSSRGAVAEPDRAANPYAVRAPHHRADREALHFPLHAGRAVAHRPVRSQAEGGRDERPAAAVRKAEARARQDGQPAGLPVEVREARPVRDRA